MTVSTATPPVPGRLAVSLGSSFLGVYAHAGFLAGLVARGIEPVRIAGASAGALAGAFHACGLRGEALRQAALAARLRWSFADAGALWRLPGLLTCTWASGLFSGHRTIAYLRRLLGERDLATLPLDIAVTDARRDRPRILRSGPLAELVMASCAVPGLFTIQQVAGEAYLDGGIACEVPFEHWLEEPGIDTILVHRIAHEAGGQTDGRPAPARPPRETLLGALGITHRTVCGELHRHRRELARTHGKRLIEVVTRTPAPGLFTQRLAPLCHDRGYASAHGLVLTDPTGEVP